MDLASGLVFVVDFVSVLKEAGLASSSEPLSSPFALAAATLASATKNWTAGQPADSMASSQLGRAPSTAPSAHD